MSVAPGKANGARTPSRPKSAITGIVAQVAGAESTACFFQSAQACVQVIAVSATKISRWGSMRGLTALFEDLRERSAGGGPSNRHAWRFPPFLRLLVQ